MSKVNCSSVGIIGAGIQGVCIGLQLLKKNIPTTIFDRGEPGKGRTPEKAEPRRSRKLQ